MRFKLELLLLMGALAAAGSYVYPRWHGLFAKLEEPAAPPTLEPGESSGRASGAVKSRRERPKVGTSLAPAAQGERLGKENDETVQDNGFRVGRAPKALTLEGRRQSLAGAPDAKGLAQGFQKPAIAPDSPALAREAPEEEARGWEERLRRVNPRAWLAGIVAVFLGGYALNVAALRRGPGGKGLTHE